MGILLNYLYLCCCWWAPLYLLSKIILYGILTAHLSFLLLNTYIIESAKWGFCMSDGLMVTSIKNASAARPLGVFTASVRFKSLRLFTMCIWWWQLLHTKPSLYGETKALPSEAKHWNDWLPPWGISLNPRRALSRQSRAIPQRSPNGSETARWSRHVPNLRLRPPPNPPSACISLGVVKHTEGKL